MTVAKHLETKVHPASREVLPDDPLEVRGVELPGDPELMLRLLVEEYARLGQDADTILEIARDPFFRAFHGLYLLYPEPEFRARVEEIVARVGVVRVRMIEPRSDVALREPSPPKAEPI